MLAWCCDLIVAGKHTVFADVVGTRLGMCGVEYFGHPWEFGPRKAKELLFTGDSLDADEAHALGMVSKVFPDEELSDRTVEFARRIARLPTVTALLIKESVNQTVDAMGFSTALDGCFKIHQLNHAHWAEVTGGALSYGTVENGLKTRGVSPRSCPRPKNDPDREGHTAVDVDYPPEAEAFRDRIRGFLAEHLPAGWSGAGALPPDERSVFTHRWRRILADRGLVAVSWPKEYGGATFRTRAGGPRRGIRSRGRAAGRRERPAGNRVAGQHADRARFRTTEETLSPRILRGEDRWCQGFSEPEAGSDLAGVRTRAVLDGDEWVVNGQKIWTSAAPTANCIFVLARTDPAAPKHQGLSFLLVRMDQPGVEMRPIVNAAGHSTFSEVFFTDARTPGANIVGLPGGGWSTAMTLLGFERGSQITTAAIDFDRDLTRLRELAYERGTHDDPRIRDELAWCYSRVQIMRYRGYRALTSILNGQRPGADAAIGKVIWSEYFRRYTELAVELLGLDVLCPQGRGNGEALMVPEAGTPNSPACWVDELLYARAATIYAGSSQIQRNVIGERLLGLPKEPRAVARSTAFALPDAVS